MAASPAQRFAERSRLGCKLHVYGPSDKGEGLRHCILASHIARLIRKHPIYRPMAVRISDVEEAKSGYGATRLEFERDLIPIARFFKACFLGEGAQTKAGFSS